jgi:hypothetical protein
MMAHTPLGGSVGHGPAEPPDVLRSGSGAAAYSGMGPLAAPPGAQHEPPHADQAQVARLLDLLHRKASLYFPAIRGEAEITLIERSDRPASRLFRFTLRGVHRSESVIVKVPLERCAPASRPRMVSPASARTKFLLEHSALTDIHRHFERLCDPRFSSVRPLDVLADERAIILEHLPSTNLRDLLFAPRRLLANGRRLDETFGRAGAWLREFHSLRTTVPLTKRSTTREDLVEFSSRCAGFLAQRVPYGRFLERAVGAMVRAARALPDTFPIAPSHGDFALRNVLVRPDASVAVIDTLARFEAPIYEDLATFLFSLRCARIQLATLGAGPLPSHAGPSGARIHRRLRRDVRIR